MRKSLFFVIVPLFVLTTGITASQAQSVVNVGAGSYASYPPTHEMNGTFTNLAQNAEIDVSPGETRAIPTNDWWTNLIYDENDQIGGQLWAMPLVVDPTTEGLNIFNPYKWNADGTNLSVDYPVVLKGVGFAASKTIVTNWSDWAVDVKLYQDINNKYLNFTMAHGMPFLWTNSVGFQPQIECYHGATYMNSTGAAITFPFTGEYFVIKYWDTFYGVHLPPGSTVTQGGTTNNLLTVNFPAGQNYIVFSALPDAPAGATVHQYAYVKPTNTTVSYAYNPGGGTMSTTWNLTTTNLRGAAQLNVMQGFLPHQYRTATSSNVTYSPITFRQSRGLLKMATGNNFTFTYKFNGLLPHYKAPQTIAGETTPYNASRMATLITNYTTEIQKTTPYGAADTYWGGKDLVRLAKYMLMAKETNHPQYTTLLNILKNSLSNWFTYTPGETERYFAWYPKWKALIGFDESYYSGVFTDNHFHYGYFIQAAALTAMADPAFVNQYSGILTMIAKQYANWDKSDGNFPFFRTFDPWMGHSYAGGVSSPTGNNQESSSEAMQSWHALFFLGAQLGNNGMRDAGAFGYMSESKATLEYWFDVNNDVWPAAYNNAHDVVGILWPGGYVYGTYFGVDPQWIHGIQMLPVSPGFHHFNNGFTKAQATTYYNRLMSELLTFNTAQGNTARTDGGVVTEAEIGNDWANVLLGFRMLFDPQYVTAKLNQYWNSTDQEERDVILYPYEGGTTYYYAHALQNLGDYQTNYYMSIPTSAAYYNTATGQTNYVVYNPSSAAQNCIVYNNGVQVTSFSVPANTLYSSLGGNTPTAAPIPGTIQAESWTAMSGVQAETTSDTGGGQNVGYVETGDWMDYSVNVASAGTYNVSFRVASAPGAGQIQLRSGATVLSTVNVAATGGWQTWTTLTATANLTAGTQTLRIHASAGGWNLNWVQFATTSSNVNLALNKPVTASTTENAGTPGSAAVDGNAGTRWSSAAADPQWIYVDLGATYNVNRVKVTWETALGKDYLVQIASSTTGTWTTMKTVTGNTALVNDHTGLSGTGRYVRIYGTARGTQWGYSIWELEVYGTATGGRLAVSREVIDLSEDESVSLYPMPVKNKLYIKGAKHGSKFTMMNVSGIVVMEDIIKDEPVDVTHLASGFYIIDVNVDEHTKVRKKIIKEH
jgi:endoglucanase Acf2